MSDLILDFHIFVEGDLTKIALLLADLAPLPHTGDVLPMKMTRSLLQCYSGTRPHVQAWLSWSERGTVNP